MSYSEVYVKSLEKKLDSCLSDLAKADEQIEHLSRLCDTNYRSGLITGSSFTLIIFNIVFVIVRIVLAASATV